MTAVSGPPWRVWLYAARVPTLSAAVVPVLVGSAAAASAGLFRPLPFLAALIAAVLIQVGTNLANDLFDFRKGADTAARLGPPRVTQSGLLSPQAVARGTIAAFGLATIIGLYLVSVGGWPVLVIGLLAIAAGVTYTGGPWPHGYHGLGDVVCFLCFGVMGVAGMYYVHTGAISSRALLASLPVGCIVTAILVVNNLRDIETDRATSKRTLAVILGRRATQAEYTLCLIGAYLIPPALWLLGQASAWWWLPWLTLPLALRLLRVVVSSGQGPVLNHVLKGTAQLHLLFGVLFSGSLLG